MADSESLQRRWYQDRPPPWWVVPVSWLYGGGVRLRRALYRSGLLKRARPPVPVIVVGNITVGGTGKTPLVIVLVEALRTRGFKPGVVSRGYAGREREPHLLDANPNPAETGDEPALIRLRTSVPVAVGADRPAAARLLLDQGVDVIVSDDGLQHYALARDVEICVVDGARRFGNGRLLPAGPLREPVARLHEVDFIVCNGGDVQPGEVPMRLMLRDAVALLEPGRTRALGNFAGAAVHVVAGIGNPRRFFDALRAFGIEVHEHPFPDHHQYTPADLAFADSAPVLMTEKDAVKCARFTRESWWAVPADASLPAAFFDKLALKLSRKNPGTSD